MHDAVARAPVDHVVEIDNRHVFSDVSKLFRSFERQRIRRRHGQRGSGRDKVLVVQRACARIVQDAVILRPALGNVDLPFIRGGLFEHLPCRRTSFTHALHEPAHRPRSVCVLIAVHGVGHRLLDYDPPPVSLELVCDNGGEAGSRALPHLTAMRNDVYGAVSVETDKYVGRPRPIGRPRSRYCGFVLTAAAGH